MRDPRLVVGLILAQFCALLLMAAWWVTLSSPERVQRLTTIQKSEHALTSPPPGILDQLDWLLAHREPKAWSMLGVALLAICIGVAEGIARRRTDILGGFLLRWWTVGIVACAFFPGVLVGYLITPWPLPFVWVACGLSGLVALATYGMAAGRPYIP